MNNEFGIDARTVRSSGGVFEVTLDGESIFSKKRSGRFPAEGEVEEILRKRL